MALKVASNKTSDKRLEGNGWHILAVFKSIGTADYIPSYLAVPILLKTASREVQVGCPNSLYK